MTTITPDILLKAYAAGIFPMAESADDDTIYWIDPDHRGIIPLDRFHVPRRLRRTVRTQRFEVRVDTAFGDVLDACAQSAPERPTTWINDRIRTLYGGLHASGHCHSIECWRDGRLVGGLYGVSLGSAFFGESMFSRETDASKVALVHLVARLVSGGYTLLDTQFVTEHLTRFGAIEIPRDAYRKLLTDALDRTGDFLHFDADGYPEAVLQPVSQTS
jgi:leucyl/phenylalanyl-tRNA--protein transferase